MTFQKGQSGNPAGRPPGGRGKAALFAEALFANDAQEIIRTAIEKAREGDIAAVRLCLDRIAPRPKDIAVDFEFPTLHSSESALTAVAEIAAAVGCGALTPRPLRTPRKVVYSTCRVVWGCTWHDEPSYIFRIPNICGGR